jgi:hypothetical protein
MQDVVDGNTGEILASRGEVVSTHMIAFWSAFKKAISKLPPVIENDGKGQRSKYATYAQSVTIIRPILLEEDFIFVHGQTRSWNADEGGGSKVRLYDIYTDFVHVPTGLLRRSHIEIPVPKLDAQAAGSALTYGKRYTLLAGLGIATADDPTDDDGKTALPARLDDDFIPSDTCIEMRDEIDTAKTAAELSKWKTSAKNVQRYQSLTEREQEMLRSRYSSRLEQLTGGEAA